jgi:predicted oxidoreductase
MTREFLVRNRKYLTICSIHAEIKQIFARLESLNPSDYKSAADLNSMVQDIISHGIEYVDVATIMGQNMEDGLKRKNETYNYLDLESNALNDNLYEIYSDNNDIQNYKK